MEHLVHRELEKGGDYGAPGQRDGGKVGRFVGGVRGGVVKEQWEEEGLKLVKCSP